MLAALPLFVSSAALAQRGPRTGTEEAPAAAQAQPRPAAIPPETASNTDHEITFNGKPLRYTATAGTLLIHGEDEKPYGSIFYVAYTLRGVERSAHAAGHLPV